MMTHLDPDDDDVVVVDVVVVDVVVVVVVVVVEFFAFLTGQNFDYLNSGFDDLTRRVGLDLNSGEVLV